MAGRTIDVSALIDGRRFSVFSYKLIVLSWLITMFDGYDMTAISYTAPYLADQFHLDKIMLGNIFSSGTVGMLLGGFVFTWLGDWIGRRPAAVLAGFSFGVLTILIGFASSYDFFLLLRFADGLAIGGMLPLAWALNIEFVPRRMRASVVTLIMIGYGIGGAMAGPITVALAPRYGWPAVYFAGGFGSLLASVLLLWGLPESVLFLVSRARSPVRIAALLRRAVPEIDANAEDEFVIGTEQVARERFRPRQLFEGQLAYITPLLWIGYTASTLAIYFIVNWSPTLIEQMHFARSTAAYVATAGNVAGMVVGLILMRFTDKKGPIAVAAFPIMVVPALLLIGMLQPARGGLIALIVLSTTLIVGGHYGINSIASIYYPTAIRASGGGWASSVAKFGGIAGPIVGGALLASGVTATHTLALTSFCPAILAACALGIAVVVRRGAAPSSRVPIAIAPER